MPVRRKNASPLRPHLLALARAAATGDDALTLRALRRLRSRGGDLALASELFAFMSAFCGWPTALAALATLHRLDPNYRPVRAPRPRSRRAARAAGWRNFRAVYGALAPSILGRIRAREPALAELLLEVPYGELYARPLIDLATKEAIACLLLALQGREPELRGHLWGARRSGLPPREIRNVLRLAARGASPFTRRLVTRALREPAVSGAAEGRSSRRGSVPRAPSPYPVTARNARDRRTPR